MANGGVVLRWSTQDPNVETFNIYRSTSAIDPAALPAALDTVVGTVTEYKDYGVTEGVTYYYRIEATKLGKTSISDSIKVVATPIAAPDVFGDGSTVATYLFDGDLSEITNGNNGVWAVGSPSYDVGQNGQCISTDGTNYVTAPVTVPGAFIAVSMWVRLNTASTGLNSVLEIEYDAGKTFTISTNSQSIGVITNGTNSSELSIRKNLTVGTFYHVYADSDGDMFIDNVQVSEIGRTAFYTNTAIGQMVLSSRTKGGIANAPQYGIDLLRIYNRKLTAQDIDTLYKRES